MRDLIEHPVTPQEVVDCLAGLIAERCEGIGDMQSLLLRTAANSVLALQMLQAVLEPIVSLAEQPPHDGETTIVLTGAEIANARGALSVAKALFFGEQ